MAAAQYDFEIEQGTTVIKPFIWKDSTGAPVNLTGFTARMQVRATIGAVEPLVSATTENSKLQIIPEEGKVILVLSAEETAAFQWKRGRYDLELVQDNGTVFRLLKGVISISLEVTRG